MFKLELGGGRNITITIRVVSWKLRDKRHRENGPSVEWANGDKFWYLNDKRHREDGPAVEYYNDDKYWYLNGKRHRKDGPAIEYPDGRKSWYLNDKEVTEEEVMNVQAKTWW